MTEEFARRQAVVNELVRLTGGDPFATVLAAAEKHRDDHGSGCGLFPAGPAVMRLAAAVIRASGARRILDLGAGVATAPSGSQTPPERVATSTPSIDSRS